MDLQRYGRAIRRNWWIVVLAVVIGILGGFAQTARTPNLYAASVTFYVSTPQLDATNSYSSDQFAQDRANSYAQLLSSQRFADRVRTESGVALSGSEIANDIVGTATVDTVLVEARIQDTSLSRLRRIQRAVAGDFPDFIASIETSDSVALRVVSTPPVSSAPVSPRRGVNLVIGLAAGLVLGLLVAALRELIDTSVRNGLELEKLAEVPLLGNIANDPATRRSPAITTADNAHTRRAEDFRQLRTNLEFVHSAQRVQVIAVTSSIASEGKSSTSLNIAATAAERGDSVLLIDADLRRPQIADYLGFDRTVGLTTVLTGRVDAATAIRIWGDHGLAVLPSGATPPNPSELLNSEVMLALMNELRGQYDLIVVDTPPVLAVTDAAVCSTFVDGFVVLYRYGKTRRANFLAALHGLRSVEARIIGVVMNMRPRRGIDGAGYDTYESYGATSTGDRPRWRQRGSALFSRLFPLETAPAASAPTQLARVRPVTPADADGRPGRAGTAGDVSEIFAEPAADEPIADDVEVVDAESTEADVTADDTTDAAADAAADEVAAVDDARIAAHDDAAATGVSGASGAKVPVNGRAGMTRSESRRLKSERERRQRYRQRTSDASRGANEQG